MTASDTGGTSRRVLRFTVAVDGEAHTLDLPHGPPLHVACRVPDEVDLWFEAVVDGNLVLAGMTQRRRLVVLPTGNTIPAHSRHLGSCVDPSGRTVWHLYELTVPGRLPSEAIAEARPRTDGFL